MLNKKDKKQGGKKGCLFLIIGSVLGVVALLLFIPLAGQLTSVIVNDTMADTMGYAMLNAAEPCIMVASLFLFGILVIHYFDFDDTKSNQRQPIQQPPKKKFLGSKAATWVATGGLLLCVVITAFVYATTYRTVSTEGVSSRICYFIETDTYEWKEVSSFKVDCDEDKGLSITFTMRDGQKIEILQSPQSAPRSFLEKYEHKEAFALDLIRMLKDQYQITPNASHVDRAKNFYKDNEALWPYVKQILEEVTPKSNVNPAPAETVADTTADTLLETSASTIAETVAETN